jgi:hypothetical protein
VALGSVVQGALVKAVDLALKVQQPAIEAYIRRAKQRRPDATPSEVVQSLERQYLSAVVMLGAGGGAAAAVPGIGTGAGLAINLAEVGSFMEASALFCMAVAEVHGIHIEDLERRRTLLLAVVMGDAGSRLAAKAAGRTGPYWARNIVSGMSMETVHAINRVLGPRFVTKYGTKQGVLVLGRDLPFGIGAAIGAGGNAAFGRMAIAGARSAFGPAPQDWPCSEGSTPAGMRREVDLPPVERIDVLPDVPQ